MGNLYFNGPNSVFKRDVTIASYLQDIGPSYSSSQDTEIRLLSVQFGDGYSQRAPDGINDSPRVFSLIFKNRRTVIIDAIENFLLGRGAVYDRQKQEYFFWTPPPPFLQIPGKFILDGKYRRTPSTAGVATFECSFREVFDP